MKLKKLLKHLDQDEHMEVYYFLETKREELTTATLFKGVVRELPTLAPDILDLKVSKYGIYATRIADVSYLEVIVLPKGEAYEASKQRIC